MPGAFRQSFLSLKTAVSAPGISETEVKPQTGVAQGFTVKLTMGRMTTEVLQHQAPPPRSAAFELKAHLVGAAAAPTEFLGSAYIHSGDEVKLAGRAWLDVLGASMHLLGGEFRLRMHQIPATAVNAPPLPFIGDESFQFLVTQVHPVDARIAENELIAEMRTLMIQPDQIRPRAAAVTDGQADPVIRIDEIARRRVEVEQREHRALDTDLGAAVFSEQSRRQTEILAQRHAGRGEFPSVALVVLIAHRETWLARIGQQLREQLHLRQCMNIDRGRRCRVRFRPGRGLVAIRG